MSRAERWAWHGAAVTCYVLPVVIFIDHGKSLMRDIAGEGSDPFAFIWFLQWWPWAISHHLNPLFTNLIWQPAGIYLAWVTSVPLLAFAGWPLTAISPVLTFNFFMLLAPVLAAFMAYLLCLHISRNPAAALIGGFLFGFSSYEMAQDTATLNLSFTMFVPALLLIILHRLAGRISRRGTILLAGVALICQFLLSVEIFGMIFVFGGIAWLLAMAYFPRCRPQLRRLVVDGLCTAPLVIVAVAPFLISMMKHSGTVNLPAIWPYMYTTDLLNFFIPSRANLFGGGLPALVSSHFAGGLQEQDGYMGLPLLLLLCLFAREQASRPAGRILLVMFLLLAAFSLGPRLWIAGHYTNLPLPWTLFVHLPLIKSALPARFALFLSLTTAIIATLWIGESAGQRNIRFALGILACLVLLPNFHPWIPSPASEFFRPGRVQAVLGANARVLVLPFSIQGPSSFWQAESHFGFVQTGGYLGFPPKSMQSYPAIYQFFGGTEKPGFLTDTANFCTATRTQFIVVGPGTSPGLRAEVAQLHWRGEKIDDVTVYAVPGSGAAFHG